MGKKSSRTLANAFCKHWTIYPLPHHHMLRRQGRQDANLPPSTQAPRYRPLIQQWVHPVKSGMEITESSTADQRMGDELCSGEGKARKDSQRDHAWGALQAVSIPIAKWWQQGSSRVHCRWCEEQGRGVGSRRVMWAATTKGFIYQDKRGIWWSSS